jgi:HD superfamily phosphodiesterase
MSKLIKKIEDHVRNIMVDPGAHDFGHADRVRNWALRIAKKEGYEDLEVVETAALMHDIGIYSVENIKEHGVVGSWLAEKFLKENNFFTSEKIAEIVNAVKFHNSNRSGSGKLLEIIRDSDMMEGLGAMGIMRCLTSKSSKPEFDPENIKSDTWQASAKYFDKRIDKGVGVGKYIIDQLNFQISWKDNLATEAAKQSAKPLIKYMEDYIIQLENEIKQGRKYT